MKKSKTSIISLLTSGKYQSFQKETDIDAALRLIVLNITYTIVSIVIISLGVTDMRNGNIDIGLVQLILGFMIFVNLLLLRTEFPFIVGALIVSVIFGSFCVICIFTKQESHGFDVLWIYLFPLISIYTLGFSAGLIPSVILFFFTVFGSFSVNIAKVNYTHTEAFLISSVYLLVLTLTAVYEYVRSRSPTYTRSSLTAAS